MNKSIRFLLRNPKFITTFYQFRYILIIKDIISFKINNIESTKKRKEVLLRKESAVLNCNDLVLLFKQLGLGKNILIHSGLGRFNKLKNKDKTLFESLKLYKYNNLLIPYFPKKTIYFNNITISDYINRKSGLGNFVEYINKNIENKLKSIHLSHTTIAIGKEKEFLVGTHHKSLTPFDQNSPFYKALLLNFDVLLIGVDLNSLTPIHIYEDILGENLFLPLYSKKYLKASIHQGDKIYTTYTKIRHRSYIIRDVELLRSVFIKKGAMKVVKYDNYELISINIRKMTFIALEELISGNSIYGRLNLKNIQLKEDIIDTINKIKNDILEFENECAKQS